MGAEIVEQVSASRKLGEERAKELIEGAIEVSVAKGKKLEVFPGGRPTQELVSKMLGATGNLRAPTIRVADQVLVGFNEDLYRAVLDS